MKPQTLHYGKEPYQIIRADDMASKGSTSNEEAIEELSNTFFVHAVCLEYGNLYVPTLFIDGIEEEKTKFNFFKAYKNKEEVVLHCEYRSTTGEYKLIVHTE